RNDRYPTARDLQADLATFAREERLLVSTIELSSFMSSLFGERVEAWREALAKGGDLLAQIEERPPPALMGADGEGRQTPVDQVSESKRVLPADMIAKGRSGGGVVLDVPERRAAAEDDALSGILPTSKILGRVLRGAQAAASSSAAAALKVTKRVQHNLVI